MQSRSRPPLLVFRSETEGVPPLLVFRSETEGDQQPKLSPCTS
ncbi:MAG: hypothetical protein ACFCUI_00275 [Bernardetiaceae bacterium]